MNKHMPKTRYICEICGFRSATSSSYYMHNKIKHEKKYDFKCPQCDKNFVSQGILNHHLRKKHIEDESERKKFQCSMCNKTTKTKVHLQEHIALHHEKISKFSCHLCERKCHSELSLKTHMKYVHSNKFIRCDFEGCGKVFKHPKDLNNHFRKSHTNVCSRVCDICTIEFSNPTSLKLHKDVVHFNFRYYCVYPGCNIEYKRKNNIRDHLKKHHTRDPDEVKKYYGLINKLNPHVVDSENDQNTNEPANV